MARRPDIRAAVLLALLAVPGFVWAVSWAAPLPMTRAGGPCGESPVGLYRGRVQAYEWVDYSGGHYQTAHPTQGAVAVVRHWLGFAGACRRQG